jgi:hypothetical protein
MLSIQAHARLVMQEVTKMLLNVYLYGALVATLAALIAAYALYRGAEPRSPFTRAALAVVAGALWPLLAVGLVQLVLIMLVTEMVRTGSARYPEEAQLPPERELIQTH